MKLSTIGWVVIGCISGATASPAGILLFTVSAIQVVQGLQGSKLSNTKCVNDIKKNGLSTGNKKYTIANEGLTKVNLDKNGNTVINAESCTEIEIAKHTKGELQVPKSCKNQIIFCTDPNVSPYGMTLYNKGQSIPENFFTNDLSFLQQSSSSQFTVNIANGTARQP